MNRIFLAAVAFAWQATVCAALAFDAPKAKPVKAGARAGKVDSKVSAARRAKAAAYDFVNKGIPLLEAGQYDAAIELFSQAIAEYPRLGKAYRLRGFALDYKNKLDEALEDLNQAVKLEPNEPDNYYVRGCVLAEMKDYVRAVDDFDVVIEGLPTVALAYRRRGWCWFRLGEYSKAFHDLNEAIRLDPRLAQAYSNRGRLFLAKGEYARAIDEFTRAIELDPKDAASAIFRAAAYYWRGDYDKCIADCGEVLQRDPEDSHAYTLRGLAFLANGKLDGAISDSTKAIGLFRPAKAAPFVNRALAWSAKDDYGKAIQDLEAALSISPHDQNAVVALGYHLAACTNEECGDANRAIEIATRACKTTDWKDAPSLDVLGMAYAEASEFEKSVEYAEKALSIAATFPDSLELQQRLRQRIELYRNGKAYRNKWEAWASEYAGQDSLRMTYQPEAFSHSD